MGYRREHDQARARRAVTSTDGMTVDYYPCDHAVLGCSLRCPFFPASTGLMIRLDNISKQHGHQILFIDASMGIRKGEKAGLVGPNGAGKTTLFRMIAGEEQPNDGQVTIDPGPPRLRQPQSH